MIVNLLAYAAPADIATAVDTVGWRPIWENLHGAQCSAFVDVVGRGLLVDPGLLPQARRGGLPRRRAYQDEFDRLKAGGAAPVPTP